MFFLHVEDVWHFSGLRHAFYHEACSTLFLILNSTQPRHTCVSIMHSQRVISHIYDDDAIENGIAADATSPSTLTGEGWGSYQFFPHLWNAGISLLFLRMLLLIKG